jgi:hypothetical protein
LIIFFAFDLSSFRLFLLPLRFFFHDAAGGGKSGREAAAHRMHDDDGNDKQ